MIKHAREQFLLSANELVDSLQRNASLSYWSLIRKLMRGTSQYYSSPPLYDNDSNELIYYNKIKPNLLNKYFCSISFVGGFPFWYGNETMAYQKVLLESFLRRYFLILSQGISVQSLMTWYQYQCNIWDTILIEILIFHY
jgi:hypothetical protein